jgi:adenylate cyclase
VTLEELKRAVDEDRLAILPVERVLATVPKYTSAEVAEKAGIEEERFAAQRRAAGLSMPGPDEKAFSDDDVEAARRLRLAVEAGLPFEAMLEGARAFGQAAAQAAAVARLIVAESLIRPGDTERDVGFRYAEAAKTLQPQTGATLQYLYEAHMRELIRSDVIASSELADGRIAGAREIAVCFADLVGFTRLGEEIGAEDLGTVAERFRFLAYRVAKPPVSLIKMIGDAAMLVSPEPEPLLDAALELVGSVGSDGEGVPPVKAGLAMGEALNRWGDWYGAPVNLASRVTAIARPSAVLVSEEVRHAANDGFAWSFAGRHRLKGVPGQVAVFRCRKARTEGARGRRAK